MFKPLTRGNVVVKVKKETKSIVDTDEITTMVDGMNEYLMSSVIRIKLSDIFIDR